MTDIFGLLKGNPGDPDYEKKGVIVQGITGAYGSLHAKNMIAYGTNIVAGVTPGKGGQKFEDKVPVLCFCRQNLSSTFPVLTRIWSPIISQLCDNFVS